MLVIILAMLFLISYPTIGIFDARSRYAVEMAKWNALDKKDAARTKAKELTFEIEHFDHEMYCHLKKNGTRWRYSFLCDNGKAPCTCDSIHAGSRKEKHFENLRSQLASIDTYVPPKPDVKMGWVMKWPVHKIESFIVNESPRPVPLTNPEYIAQLESQLNIGP